MSRHNSVIDKYVQLQSLTRFTHSQRSTSGKYTHDGRSVIFARITAFSLAMAVAIAMLRRASDVRFHWSRISEKITGVMSHATDQFM